MKSNDTYIAEFIEKDNLIEAIFHNLSGGLKKSYIHITKSVVREILEAALEQKDAEWEEKVKTARIEGENSYVIPPEKF